MENKYHTISDIVATIYCEQKAILDRDKGDKRPASVRAKAIAGTYEHSRFEAKGRAQAAIDRRCFIASAIYGPEAPETIFLRIWRDRYLMPSKSGRAFVRVYYSLSPWFVKLLNNSPWLASLVRSVLTRFLVVQGFFR